MRVAASVLSAGALILSLSACDRVSEPVTTDSRPVTPTPLTSTGASTASETPSRCIKAWGEKASREPFVSGFVAPDCPDKGDELTPDAPNEALRTITVSFPDASESAPPSVTAEVADSGAARQRGLMLRKSMPENRAMLFVFQQRKTQAFWMHNTCIPLDMMFIDKDGFITGIEENVPTMNDETYTSGCPSTYVLEVNAGWSRKHGVKPGQFVKIEGL